MIDLFIRVKQQQEQQLPFVIYKKPDEQVLNGIFQKNDHLYFGNHFKDSGFIMAPFNGSQVIMLPLAESEYIIADFDQHRCLVPDKPSTVTTDGSDFKSLVQKALAAIDKGFFSKVVLSRKEIVAIPDFDAVQIFEKMTQAYPGALVYCWFHPKIGFWMGATPESLIKANNQDFSSVSLAGTQSFDDRNEVKWQPKEKQEQLYVTDYILENLKKITSEIVVSSPYTVQAGNLLHIKTDIAGKLNANSSLQDVVFVLHPTPAVCGVPKLTAKDFIIENEGYDREYYTGFLGELNFPALDGDQTDLFVNLRCMQIVDDEAHLYVGCGITKGSDPTKEFEETVNKSMTMKNIIL